MTSSKPNDTSTAEIDPLPSSKEGSPVKKNMTLSPAVSAFQFKPVYSPHPSAPHHPFPSLSPTLRLQPAVRSNSTERVSTSDSLQTANGRSIPRPPVAETPFVKDGYVYKDEVVILDQEKKDALLKVGEISLQTEWTFWYDRFVHGLSAAEYEANLQVISTTGTVQKFWSVYNNIDGPEKLGFRSNLHFMRKGIKPIWEDPCNEYGGSFNFKIPKQNSPIVWRDLLVLLIGEKMEGIIEDVVCGVSVSSRQQFDNYQIWTAKGHNPAQDVIVQQKLTSLMKPVELQSFYFKIHKNHAAFQRPKELNGKSWQNDTIAVDKGMMMGSTEMRRKITEENIERVVADIERLSMRHKERTRTGTTQSSGTTNMHNKDIK